MQVVAECVSAADNRTSKRTSHPEQSSSGQLRGPSTWFPIHALLSFASDSLSSAMVVVVPVYTEGTYPATHTHRYMMSCVDMHACMLMSIGRLFNRITSKNAFLGNSCNNNCLIQTLTPVLQNAGGECETSDICWYWHSYICYVCGSIKVFTWTVYAMSG